MAHATPEFDRFVENVMSKWKVPGLAMAVVHGDDIYIKSYGAARIDDQAVTSETLFDCASLSKSFTAASIALLMEDKDKYPAVGWDTPMSKLLPDDFVLSSPAYTENVTIEDVLSHRTGLPGHEASYLGSNAAKPDNPRSITRNLRNLPTSRPLRTAFQYNNQTFTAASYLVEALSGEKYADYLQTHFWSPLSMTNTYHDVNGVKANNATERMATGYRWDKKAEKYVDLPSWNQPEGQGAGCIFSSAQDWAKWIQAMIKSKDILRSSTHKELLRPRMIASTDDDDKIPFYSTSLYALGWFVESYRGNRLIGHSGGVPGFQSLMRFLPDREWGVVFLGNSDTAYEAEEIVFGHLMDEFLGIPVSHRVDWAAFWKEKYEKEETGKGQDPYPDRPDTPLELGVPLKQVAGTYYNPGYHEIVLSLIEGVLRADMTDRCWRTKMTLEHVSGGDFVAKIVDMLDDDTSNDVKAQLEVEGHTIRLGIAFEEDMGEDLIWFEKVDPCV